MAYDGHATLDGCLHVLFTFQAKAEPPHTRSSLGTVLEELFAGLLLEPVCTLGRHGLLHLRHVVF